MKLFDREKPSAKRVLIFAVIFLLILLSGSLTMYFINLNRLKAETLSLASLSEKLSLLEADRTRATGETDKSSGTSADGTEQSGNGTEQSGSTEGLTDGTTEAIDPGADKETRAPKDYDKLLSDDYRFQVVQSYRNIGVIINVANFLNIRREPNMESSIVGKGTPYAAFEIIGESGDWYQIEVDGLTGYVHKDYVATGEAGEILAMEHCNVDAYAYTEAPLHSLPSEASRVLTALHSSGHYIVLDTIGKWVKLLAYDTVVGYVKDEDLGYRYSMSRPFFFTDSSGTVTLSKQRLDIIGAAFNYYGGSYVWGGTDLETGVDCSGYVLRIYEKFGIYLPRLSSEQAKAGTALSSIDEAKPGDLLFFHGYRNGVKTDGVGHVAIYIGSGMMIHAASEARGIVIDPVCYVESPVAIRRVIND